MVIAGPAAADTPVPHAIRRLVRGGAIAPRWRNTLGGVAFEIGPSRDAPRRFAKWAPAESGLDLAAEADRLRWAGDHVLVPEVLDTGEDDDGAWLVSRAIDGESAVAERWIGRPEIAVPAIGRALRRLHDALPVRDCPFDWSVSSRIEAARAGGIEVPRALEAAPPTGRLVVCHGDACAPNTLLDDAGRGIAHVDLGALGVADRWADIAVAAWSTEWNYGPGWTETLVDAYGVEDDPIRSAYYRALWDAT